jgi:hypothetical protein
VQYIGFVQSMSVSDSSPLDNSSSLAIIRSSCVTLIHVTISDTTTQFLDIAPENIKRCNHDEEREYMINLELVHHSQGNYSRDGSALWADKFSLSFGDREQANNFLAALKYRAPHL